LWTNLKSLATVLTAVRGFFSGRIQIPNFTGDEPQNKYNAAMSKRKITILRDQIEQRFLPFVRSPSRYIGGEVNQIKKNLNRCDMRVALCFPDIYEIAASHTGLAIIYEVLNRIEGVAAERAFAPWIDAEEIMRAEDIPLFTLESKVAIKDFDVIGFSLTTELASTNLLNMLGLASLASRSAQRSEDDPIVIAGGQIPNCGEPVSEFIDIFILGDGEEAVVKLIELIRKLRAAGTVKKDILLEVAKTFSFAYVPSLYKFEYAGAKIKSFLPVQKGLPLRFENAVVTDLDNSPVPAEPIVPFVKAVHERVSVEIMRGCSGRCRFCQASFCRRPIRYRSVEKIVEIAKQNYHATGFDTVSLLSLSTGEYPHIEELVIKLQKYFQPRHVGISLPSLRVAAQLKLMPQMAASVRKSGLTIAVEAASERMRKIINKPISDSDLFAAAKTAYQAGFSKIKLYFMAGLPGETLEDIKQIVELTEKLGKLRKEVDNKIANINAAISWFVPKPHTPFAWMGQRPIEYFKEAKDLILDEKHRLRARFVKFKFHSIEQSIVEAALARSGREACDIIETAWRNGARFDLWSECFDYQIWEDAFREHDLDINAAAQKSFGADDILPWEHLGGPEKKGLLEHYNEAMKLVRM
jgi:radical SAM family uncharacterized protein